MLTAEECGTSGGQYQGDGTVCEPNPCPQPTGACCAASGDCSVLTAEECGTSGGQYQGDGTVCEPNPCPQPTGACCLANGQCAILTAAECLAASGVYQGHETGCTPDVCPQPCCRGDVNGDGLVSDADVAEFIAGLLAPPEITAPEYCPLDVNADEGVDGRDVQHFVDLILAGTVCPNNDSCFYATLLPLNEEVIADNTEATTDPADPPFSCRSGGGQGVGTLWYKFVAADTTALISTCGSNAPVQDTLLAVYRPDAACPFGVGDELACSEDDCGAFGRLSRIFLNDLTPGATYYLQVAAYSDASRGPIRLRVECPAVGACCLPGGVCSIRSAEECAIAGGSYEGNGTSCAPDPCVTGACCTPIGLCEIRTQSSCSAVGGTYQGNNSDCGGVVCPPPYYDDCVNAELTGCGLTTVLHNTSATLVDPTDPLLTCIFPAPARGERSVWLKFQAARSSALIRTCATPPPVTDTQIAVYNWTGACPFTQADQIACNEDSCGRLSSVCVTGLIPGNVYHVLISTSGSVSPGPITVEILCPCP